ncbi:hypothetical protein BH11ACT5_BH11ACT5_10180 [soil metagenome]
MTVRSVEVLPTGTAAVTSSGVKLEWPVRQGEGSGVQTSLFWNLEQFSGASTIARDLVRIAGAAFLADSRLSKPEVSLHRDIALVAHVENPTVWSPQIRTRVADLLHWLTGDSWSIDVSQSNAIPSSAPQSTLRVDRVQLLSGGLDSLCGAVVGLRDGASIGFLGMRDSNNAVRHAQDTIAPALGNDATYFREELFLARSAIRKNHGPRSRSLLYMVIGVLAAGSFGASDVWVPENGFTSINPPLSAARGGTLTTRSTHPYTFELINTLIASLGLGVTVSNPFGGLTKGELVALAGNELVSERWLGATRESYSCGVGNTQLHGGNPNHNCGLCVACIVRRASFIGGKVKDPTPYASLELTGSSRAELESARAKDVVAVKRAASQGLDEDEVLSSAVWPVGTDFDAVLDLVDRGLKELRGVRLPTT